MKNVLKVPAEYRYCNRCASEVKHRWVKSKGRSPYYACSRCLERNSVKHRKHNWFKYLAQKANARKLPMSDHLTESDILKLAEDQEYKCDLTGIEFDVESRWWKASLDRIRSDEGYTKDNIRLVAWIVNHSKGELTDDEFINMCRAVAEACHRI